MTWQVRYRIKNIDQCDIVLDFAGGVEAASAFDSVRKYCALDFAKLVEDGAVIAYERPEAREFVSPYLRPAIK